MTASPCPAELLVSKQMPKLRKPLRDMYPIFWTPLFELNNEVFIMDASLNLQGGIHFFPRILLLL